MFGVLIDIDGVIYEGDRLVPGAREAVGFLRRHAVPFLFVTNTSSRPVADIVAKLKSMRIDVSARSILTPALAAQSYILANYGEPAALFICPSTREDFGNINALEPMLEDGARSVVIGDLGENWDFQTLNRAFRLLIASNGAPVALIALGMTKYFRAASGLQLDVGPFVSALEFATGQQAVVMGKPAASFFQQAANRLELPLGDLLMVGDDISSDILGAQNCGMTGILVRTGKFREADLLQQAPPSAVIQSIADLPGWLEANRPMPTRSA